MPVCCQLPNLRESHNFQDAWSNTTRRAQYLRFIFSRAKRLIVVIARDDHWSLLPIFAAFDRGRQPKADPNLYLENCRICGTKAKVSEDCKDQTTEFKIL